MKTITIQIGNSDDKLTQKEWSQFVAKMSNVITNYAYHVHFFGAPVNWAEWQNATWVIASDDRNQRMVDFKNAVGSVRKEFRQDSVAWTEGETEFV